jgi:glutaredoxin
MKKLIKFSRPSCTPCKVLSLHLNSNGVQYEEVNVEEDPLTAQQYGISGGLPVLVLVDGETEVNRTFGFNPGNTSEVDDLVAQLNS